MQRPRRPHKNAGAGAWEIYWKQMDLWEQERSQHRWRNGGAVDGKPAKVKQEGRRIEALWGGTNPEGDGKGHGHIVSNDGLNAAHVKYPGEASTFTHNEEDKRAR